MVTFFGTGRYKQAGTNKPNKLGKWHISCYFHSLFFLFIPARPGFGWYERLPWYQSTRTVVKNGLHWKKIWNKGAIMAHFWSNIPHIPLTSALSSPHLRAKLFSVGIFLLKGTSRGLEALQSNNNNSYCKMCDCVHSKPSIHGPVQ